MIWSFLFYVTRILGGVQCFVTFFLNVCCLDAVLLHQDHVAESIAKGLALFL